jgi:hypothetical protein
MWTCTVLHRAAVKGGSSPIEQKLDKEKRHSSPAMVWWRNPTAIRTNHDCKDVSFLQLDLAFSTRTCTPSVEDG